MMTKVGMQDHEPDQDLPPVQSLALGRHHFGSFPKTRRYSFDAAAAEDFGLLQPVVARGAPLEAGLGFDRIHLLGRQRGDLPIGRDADGIEGLLDRGTDAQ